MCNLSSLLHNPTTCSGDLSTQKHSASTQAQTSETELLEKISQYPCQKQFKAIVDLPHFKFQSVEMLELKNTEHLFSEVARVDWRRKRSY
ncbi:hypothetical protein NC652_018247 [Populus alba x Populus x berolinensis]|nr:hypothetical protein NC652_018247 [Populus alba x Populus x berolinensis]